MNTLDHADQPARLSAKIASEIIRATGTRTFLSAVVKELTDVWAKRGGFRGKIASPVNWMASKVLKPHKDWDGKGISADVGRLLTAWARKINTDHASDPVCHARKREDAIHDFLKSTDFGEIREMVEGSEQCVLKTVETFNESLWKYPAKVGSILATLLAAANTGIRSIRETLRPIEKNIGPDLLADLILSLLKGLNAKEVAELINAANEFIRRLHTGSCLLAEAGKPLFRIYLTTLLKEALPHLDPVLMRKAKIALSEDKEAMAHALADALSDNPAMLIETISAYGAIRTPLIKGASRRVRLYEDIGHDSLAEAASKGLSDLDTFEVAEIINGCLRVINRIHDLKPGVFSNTAHGIADSIDTEEVRSAAEWIIPEIVDAARPVLSASLPLLINGLCSLLTPQEGLENRSHQEAISNLKAAFLAAGGGR